jgi:hypothetical protein
MYFRSQMRGETPTVFGRLERANVNHIVFSRFQKTGGWTKSKTQ